MSISDKYFYHGAALSLLVCSKKFTVLSPDADLGNGVYRVNQDRCLMIKYASDKNGPWQFTFNSEHEKTARELFKKFDDKAFIALVCGKSGVCLLTYGEYASLINEDFVNQASITVRRPSGGSFHVKGPKGELDQTVPANRFPNDVVA